MHRKTLVAFAALTGLTAAGTQAMPFGGGAAVTDRFGYSGTILRYDTLADARDGINSIDRIEVDDRDLSLSVTQDDRDYADANILMGSWWYTTDEQGRAGWGNTTGNTGVGFMQLFDDNGSTDTAVSMAFSNFDGTYYTDFSLSLSGENAAADDFARLSTYDNVNDGGAWYSYALSLTATGLQGQMTAPNIIEAGNHPTGVTGSFTGIFELTENQTSPANQGFYSVDFSLSMTIWAFANEGDLTGPYQVDGGIYPSEFRVLVGQVPAPGIPSLLGLGLVMLALRRRG